jgi:hypothetical protein
VMEGVAVVEDILDTKRVFVDPGDNLS